MYSQVVVQTSCRANFLWNHFWPRSDSLLHSAKSLQRWCWMIGLYC